MPNESKLVQKPKANRGLMDFFRPAVDTVAAMDPTDTLLQLLSGVKKAPPPMAVEGDYNFIPSAPELGDPLLEQAINRQNKVKKTFGKIPGR